MRYKENPSLREGIKMLSTIQKKSQVSKISKWQKHQVMLWINVVGLGPILESDRVGHRLAE
jgi:hypothetical protein